MRLRRETGDYRIKITDGVGNTIPAGLLVEDLLGAVIETDGTALSVVVEVSKSSDIYTLYALAEGTVASYTYNKLTGEVSVEASVDDGEH